MTATLAGCGRLSEPHAPEPTARVVRVVVTATPEPAPQPTEALALPTLSPAGVFQSAVIESRLPTPLPTIDVATIPNLDRPREPTPESRTEQLMRCLTFTVAEDDHPRLSSWPPDVARVKVMARNNCGFWIAASESWFEVTSMPVGHQGAVGREIDHFPVVIGPSSSNAETFVMIKCPDAQTVGCHYSVAVWWAAGGGKKAE